MIEAKIRWGVHRGTGYDECRLRIDRKTVSRCNGGGYDMVGTVWGDWLAKRFAAELRQIKTPMYGLTWHDPNFNADSTVLPGGQSLLRYQAAAAASSHTITDRHTVPHIDGATGYNCVQSIALAIGVRIVRTEMKGDSADYDVYLPGEYPRHLAHEFVSVLKYRLTDQERGLALQVLREQLHDL